MSEEVALPRFARDLLHDLRTRFGLEQWVLTRVVESDAMVIFADGDLGLPEGATIPWGNSLEARLVDGGPLVARDVAEGPYAGAVPPVEGVRGFVGVPVHTADGALFGALYGVGRTPTALRESDVALPLSLAARSLRLLLEAEQVRVALGPTAASTRGDTRRDRLTGLLNRQGWDEALAVEEARCRRYGNHATVVRVVVGGLHGGPSAGAPDEVVVRQAGDALRAWRRGADVVARTGETTFSVLLVEAWEEDAVAAVRRLGETMAARHLDVLLGVADNRSRSLLEAADVAAERALGDA